MTGLQGSEGLGVLRLRGLHLSVWGLGLRDKRFSSQAKRTIREGGGLQAHLLRTIPPHSNPRSQPGAQKTSST